MPATSFISEHTAEYYLTNTFLNLFKESPYNVIPFYYWKSREGANQSKECGKGNDFRLVAIYPRRPKINKPDQSYIEVKINQLLFATTKIFDRFNIPVLAGVPLASSLLNLSYSNKCCWFYLKPILEQNDDLLLELSLDNTTIINEQSNSIEIVSTEGLIDFIINKTNKRSWLDCIESINNIREEARMSEQVHTSLFSWFGYYKPFYLAVF